MKIASPEYFWALFVVPLLVILFSYGLLRKKQLLSRFASAGMVEKLTNTSAYGNFMLRATLVAIAFIFLVLAMIRPQWGTKMEIMKQEGLDVLLVQDISLSMLAEDIKPNRLTRSKHEISSFLERSSGDRIGLIAFSGEPQLQCPLTLDYSAVRMFLDELNPNMLMPGTNIGAAMEKAIETFDTKQRKYQVIVLLTDGEEHDPKVLEVAKKAAEEGIVIYTVGIGSTAGVPIPVGRRDGSPQYKKDRRGNIVTTKLDQQTLQKIALLTDGKYYHAGPGEFELVKILEEIEQREKREVEGENVEQYVDRFQIPLALALMLLLFPELLALGITLLEKTTPYRHKKKKKWEGRFV
ncbi:MAG: VWA domain-containing protein [Fibrobacterales bacterium]